MGIILDSISALVVNSINRRRNRISRPLIDVVNTNDMIMCGGSDIRNYRGRDIFTLAGELKINTCIQALQQAKKDKRAVILLCDDSYIANVLSYIDEGSESIFGVNVSYSPLVDFNSRTTSDDIMCFFKRIIRSYYKNNESEIEVVFGVIQMVISILETNGVHYITLENIDTISSEMFKNNEWVFIKRVEELIGHSFLSEWMDYLTLTWDLSKTKYQVFWKSFMNAIGKYRCNTGVVKSIYSLISSQESNNSIICKLHPSDKMLKSILLSEIEMTYKYANRCNLIDYHVELPNVEEYSFLTRIRYSFIGNSLRELGINKMPFDNPTLICLGVNNLDAEDIMSLLVYTGHWIRVTVGHGIRPNHLNIGFTGTEIKPITPSDLSSLRIHDGSALRIDHNGYAFIDNIFF